MRARETSPAEWQRFQKWQRLNFGVMAVKRRKIVNFGNNFVITVVPPNSWLIGSKTKPEIRKFGNYAT